MSYLNKNNNFFHGIMFHHFHDEKKHLKGQGSISKDNFYKIIKFIGKENILNANEFFNRFKEKKLSKKNVCLTFDDSLKCQYDIALPVLHEMKIEAFFFIYTSIFREDFDMLEIYRHFRLNFYKNVDDFYNEFFDASIEIYNINLEKFFTINKQLIEKVKKNYPYYSYNDVKFRLFRDDMLSKEQYSKIMLMLFEKKKFNYNLIIKDLFLNKNDIKKLSDSGHLVGLHSHSHPPKIENLNYDNQFDEYRKNLDIISEILNKKKIVSMSHPCGSYDKNTLNILKKLNIEIGFRDNMSVKIEKNKINNSQFELAREDHSNIMRMLN